MAESRYTYQDLGICVLVADGTHALAMTHHQATQLIQQPYDNERDALFLQWVRDATEGRHEGLDDL